jgi:hypothetical protein
VSQKQDYLIALKRNQPTLFATIEHLHRSTESLNVAESLELVHNREVHRKAWVYAAPEQLQQSWAGLATVIWVERWGIREGKPFHESALYISTLVLSAAEFLPHIQQHWGIENRLHWVRDVTFDEDHARPGEMRPCAGPF